MKVGLGTAQFGLDYGVSNTRGKVTPDEARQIVAKAADLGVRVIDTAALYGDSEEILGEVLPSGHSFEIISKTPKFDTKTSPAEAADRLEESVLLSRRRLRSSALDGLLFHEASDLYSPVGEALIAKAKELKTKGFVRKWGVSVYDSEQIDRVLDRTAIDLIQLPLSIFDQRLIISGHLSLLREKAVEIHSRSCFLQGLMFLDPEELPSHFTGARERISEFHRHRKGRALTVAEAAIGFVASLPEVSRVICGVTRVEEIVELCQAENAVRNGIKKLDADEYARFALDDVRILNPSFWPKWSSERGA